MEVSPQSLSVVALAPLGFLMAADGPTSSIALWGMLITLVAGLVGRWLDNRKEENRHRWEMEERAASEARIRDDLVKHRSEVAGELAENTAITKAVLANQLNADDSKL